MVHYLYTGEFATGTQFLQDPYIKNCIEEKLISVVYMDNTLAFAKDSIEMETACSKIDKIIR